MTGYDIRELFLPQWRGSFKLIRFYLNMCENSRYKWEEGGDRVGRRRKEIGKEEGRRGERGEVAKSNFVNRI